MAKYHPDIHLLTEYSAGSLPVAFALCVATHLEFCVQCRNHLHKLDALGGSLMESIEPEADGSFASIYQALENTLAAIDAIEDTAAAPGEMDASHALVTQLPKTVRNILDRASGQPVWKKISASLSVAQLQSGDMEREVALHKLRAGGGVADHDHRGQEITVVLQGSFSDQNGLYMPGDFVLKEAGEIHAPKASEDGDCICLSAMTAPVKFTGAFTRLLNPFLKIHPSTS